MLSWKRKLSTHLWSQTFSPISLWKDVYIGYRPQTTNHNPQPSKGHTLPSGGTSTTLGHHLTGTRLSSSARKITVTWMDCPDCLFQTWNFPNPMPLISSQWHSWTHWQQSSGKSDRTDRIYTQQSLPIYKVRMASSSQGMSQTILVLMERDHGGRRLLVMGHQSSCSQEIAGGCTQRASSWQPRHCQDEGLKRKKLRLVAGFGQVTGTDSQRMSSM